MAYKTMWSAVSNASHGAAGNEYDAPLQTTSQF